MLVRQYKEARPPAGVFILRNQVNGRVYVDGSLHLEGLMNRHRFELNLRSHRNKPLQKDWIEFGAAQFSFEVIDRIKERDDPLFDYAAELQHLLALWREEYRCHGEDGYNGAPS
ncbi:GIY-YIG nuclease family protein [Acidovorax sp. SRB_24]|uniref:GIY-YIG nuclease family protein n=1 Tax=Acidovorax sp. SRB_24 TaxID=1962700 RepID=UPI00145D4D9A|nr:GIY-YIG nuclease family protein [Acidovorax sp. SRB_24]NMM78588.1 ArsR family transcriptional regulator [Acidovorax sp. SRB_24]